MTEAANVALITGASSGIGAVYADRLARRGRDLILVARRGERLRRVAEAIRAATGRTVEPLIADLADSGDQRRVADILRNDPRIGMLINNAGIGATAPLLKADPDQMAGMISLNVSAVSRLTHAAAAGLAQRGGGAIINISSIVAIGPEFLNGVYGGSKAFVLALSQSIRRELAGKGVRIQVVLPGATATEFWTVAGRPLENMPNGSVMPVDDMVDAALAGFDRGEFVTIPALPDIADWQAFENARRALLPKLSRAAPALRYRRAEPPGRVPLDAQRFVMAAKALANDFGCALRRQLG